MNSSSMTDDHFTGVRVRLSIITINRNNASGLERTMLSVANQTFKEFEYIVIDGASADNSVDVIERLESDFPHLIWVSESDRGIYNAMNKGLRMATGDYIQILNSGDCLAAPDVTERMLASLERKVNPSIIYGNMIKCFSDGRRLIDKSFAGHEITMLGMYTGTLNHNPAYIRHDLFSKYGYYDESLKIVSDWKWYLQAVILGDEKPQYVDIDVTLFDMTGISETNKELDKAERKQVLESLFPKAVLADYNRYAFPIDQIRRLQRHPWAYKMVWLLERCLFKMEKAKRKKNKVSKYE
jgi:glycosyltransferase involved in cell wall biosynthesis